MLATTKMARVFYGKSFLNSMIMGIEYSLSVSLMFKGIPMTTHAALSQNYITRNLISQIVSSVVIRKISTFPDKNVTATMKCSQLIYQVSLGIDCLLPLTSSSTSLFLFSAGTSSLLKTVTWVWLGALDAKVINKMKNKENENIGELYSNIMISHQLGNTIGAVIGLLFMNYVNINNYIYALAVLGPIRYIIVKNMYQ